MSEIREIIGNTTATPNPRPDWEQTDTTKADYIKNKPTILTEEQVIDLIEEHGVGTSSSEAFHYIKIDGVDITPDREKDTLVIEAGANISFNVTESNDSVIISAGKKNLKSITGGQATNDASIYVRCSGVIGKVVEFDVVTEHYKEAMDEYYVVKRDHYEIEIRTDERDGYYEHKELTFKSTATNVRAIFDKVDNAVYIYNDYRFDDYSIESYPQFEDNFSFVLDDADGKIPIPNGSDVIEVQAEIIPTQAYIDEKLGDIEGTLDSIIAIQESLIGGDTE